MNTIERRIPIKPLGVILALVWISSVGATAYAQDTKTALGEADRLLAELQKEKSTTVGLALVKAVGRLSEWMPRRTYAERLDAAAKAAKDPRVAFALHQKAAWAFAELEDDRYGGNGMTGPLGKQGCLVDWQVVGPFDNPSNEAFATALGPELGEVGPYPGKLVDVDWRELGPEDRYCEVGLNRSVQPSTAAVAYLGSTVTTKKAARGLLLLGADGSYKVWVNGELVALRDVDRGMAVDSDAWPIKLKAGTNNILIKVASAQDGGLGVIARLVDSRLKPLSFEATAKRKLLPTKSAPIPSEDKRALHLQLVQNAKSFSGDKAVWNAWLWQSTTWQDVAVPWRDVAERLLQNPDAIDPRLHALMSELYEEYWRQIDIVQAAAARNPQDPWIAVRQAATLELSLTEPDKLKARDIYARTWKANPAFLPAVVYLSDWYKGRNFDRRALTILDEYQSPDRLTTPAFGERFVSLHRNVGDLAKSKELEQTAWKAAFITSGYVWRTMRDLAQDGKLDAAIELVDRYLTFAPGSQYAMLRRADLLRANNDIDGALATYRQLRTWAPGDPDLYSFEAKLLLELGRVQEATQTYRKALEQRPQDQGLRDFLAFLQPDDRREFEPWLVKDVREIAAGFEPSPFNYDTIVDNSVTFVSKNGLASTVFQRVDRVLNADGIDVAKSHSGSYQMGDEVAEVLAVRVHKPDGSISEDYDHWDSGGTRKASTTYNDSASLTMRANDVAVGDLIEFRYRVSQVANENFRGDYFGDIAYLQGGRPMAMQRYAVVYPSNWELFFRAPKLKHERVDNQDPNGNAPGDGFRSTSFVMRDVPHVESDRRQPGYSDVYDYLLVSNKRTYDEIGKWWWNLVQEQLIVDEPIRKKVDELVEGLKSDTDKVKAIQNYVVKNTRYLHVGLGIHGWKPYRTSTCFRNRYGDCKDKAALLKVMLEAAGVKANLVLVRTRRLGSVEAVPASMHVFNHAITYVPSMDLYLDGTAEFNGTTELTSMDQGAQALIVEDGGAARFVTLPIDKSSANVLTMNLEVDLSGEEPVTRGTLTATGANAVYFRQSLEDPERRDEALEKQLSDEFPGAKLVRATYRNLDDLEKPTIIDFEMNGGELQQKDGKRTFVYPVGRPKSLLDSYAKRSRRTQDLTIRVPFTSETKIRYRLGPRKKFAKPPADASKKSKFGAYSVQYKTDGNDLVVDVTYSIDVQRVSVNDYKKFREFMADATAALNDSIAVEEAQ